MFSSCSSVTFMEPPYGVPPAGSIVPKSNPDSSTPFSIVSLKRCRSSSTCRSGFEKTFATASPAAPAGGSYSIVTSTCVSLPAGLKFTRPAVFSPDSAPWMERQPIASFG